MTTYALDPEPIVGGGDIVAGDAAERARDQLYLGKLAESGRLRNLWLDVSGEQVVAVLGKRGTGKSYTLGVLIEGLAAGRGDSPLAKLHTPRGGLIVDIMDIFWTSQIPLTPVGSPEIVRQHEFMRRSGLQAQSLAVDVWIPAGFERPAIDPAGLRQLNLGAADLELDDWGALFEVDMFSEPRGMLIADVMTHVGILGYSASNGSRVPPATAYGFPELIACLDDDVDIASNYRPDTIRSVRQRMTTYGALPLFSGGTTPLVVLLPPFRVSVLMLARVPDALKKVLIAVLLRRLLRERRDASFAQKRLDLDQRLSADERALLEQVVHESVPRAWVLMDEAHVLAGSDDPSVARDALIKYAKEGRNYGLSLALATQQPSALDPRLMSQVETLLVHQLTAPRDAAVATQNMRSPEPARIRVDGSDVDVPTLLRRLTQGTAAFSCGNAPSLNRLCVTSIRPRITAHGGYEA
jgi:uncharacterized protein